MMNVLQVQDDLKNFSQDQLISEMQQPSGNAPQFLVLSELNRRKRVKGDLEARQASTQQTVAQDAVASAGVPQQGMMGMSEAMAPQSAESGGIGAMMPQTMKNGGVIRAADGLPEETNYGDEFLKYIGDTGEDIYRVGKAALSGLDEEMLQKLENQPDDTALGRSGKFLGRMINEAHPYNLAKNITDPLYNFATKPLNEYDEDTEQDNKNIAEENNALIGNGNKEVETKPKLESTSTEEKPLTIEQELLKRQADLEKNKNSDKWMALAQAGLAIMGSNNPNLAGAIGEGGTAGLTAFGDSNKRYQEGLTDILNARAKMETARLSAAGKGRLTRAGALSAISSYNNSITAIRKEIGSLMDSSGAPGVDEQINQLKEQIIGLETEKSQLYDNARIRPRASINVGKLPSKQKAS